MAVGQGAQMGYNSYVAVGRETTLGTYNTATASLDPLSSSFMTKKETKVLEQITTFRSHAKRVGLGKSVEGEIESYAFAESAGFVYLLQNALGGTLTSATTASETTGAASLEHTIQIGNMDQSYPSLCFNIRYGDSTSAFIYQYSGVRVNEMMFSAEIGEALKYTVNMVAFDSTKTTGDVSGSLGANTFEPLSFINGRLSAETSFASLTSTSFWHIQQVEFGIQNNLKSDNASRRIGSDLLTVLPPGVASFPLSATIRFDTVTAFNAMINETQYAVELEFTGTTLTGSKFKRSLKLQYQKVFINEATEPEISGPDSVLTSKVNFLVLRDDSSVTGYPLRAIVRNLTSSYA